MLPLQYAQHVLVPKIAARLIRQDMQLKDFGVTMQPMQKARKLGNFPNSSCRSKDRSTIVFFVFHQSVHEDPSRDVKSLCLELEHLVLSYTFRIPQEQTSRTAVYTLWCNWSFACCGKIYAVFYIVVLISVFYALIVIFNRTFVSSDLSHVVTSQLMAGAASFGTWHVK